MCTQVHLEPKRPRISTYLGESFQLICWIFSEVFWLSEYRILARLTKKWPLVGTGAGGGSAGGAQGSGVRAGTGGQGEQLSNDLSLKGGRLRANNYNFAGAAAGVAAGAAEGVR